jgi:D-glycero-alpha-D-manno-heptose-7-phosphate kinase
MEELFDQAFRHGAIAGKACGAGGGGCVLFFTAPDQRRCVEQAVERLGSRVIPFEFEFEGLCVTEEETVDRG